MADRPLRRSRGDRWLGGVLGGLAAHYRLGSGGMRVVYVLLSILSAAFPGILVYILLWLLIPMED